MGNPLAVTFTGLRFENPFLLSSAPPTESDSNIMRAFDAGWGGVVTKTIGLHPVVNVARPEDQVPARRRRPAAPLDAEAARHGAPLVVELGADLGQAARLVAAAASSGSSRRIPTASWSRRSWPARAATSELEHWQTLAKGCQDAGADALRAEPVLPAHGPQGHGLEHRQGPGADLDRHAGREGSRAGAGLGQADAVDHRHRRRSARRRSSAAPTPSSSSNTFPSLPLIDPETLEFEMNVDGYVSSGGLGGPAILPQSLAKMAQLTQAFPDKAFSGIGGIVDVRRRRSTTSCSAAARCRSARRRCSITPSGPNVIKALNAGMTAFFERHADRGWHSLEDIRGMPPRSRRHALADQAARTPRSTSAGTTRPTRPGGLRAAGGVRPDERARRRTSSSSPRTCRRARSGTPTSRRPGSSSGPGPPTTSPPCGLAWRWSSPPTRSPPA